VQGVTQPLLFLGHILDDRGTDVFFLRAFHPAPQLSNVLWPRLKKFPYEGLRFLTPARKPPLLPQDLFCPPFFLLPTCPLTEAFFFFASEKRRNRCGVNLFPLPPLKPASPFFPEERMTFDPVLLSD